jgi:hypothetical protein
MVVDMSKTVMKPASSFLKNFPQIQAENPDISFFSGMQDRLSPLSISSHFPPLRRIFWLDEVDAQPRSCGCQRSRNPVCAGYRIRRRRVRKHFETVQQAHYMLHIECRT